MKGWSGDDALKTEASLADSVALPVTRAAFRWALAPGPLSVLLIAMIHVLTFYRHYAGVSLFPWDFVCGYHAGAFSYFRDLYFGSFQQWEPHGSMGYPTALALQNSSYYWPLMLLTALGVPYTHHVAAAVQSLHVLFAGFGMLALLSSRQVGCLTATLGAVAFMFSAAFFSNAQHTDIVRGAAYVPWLFLGLSPALLIKGRWHMVWPTILLAGFLAGSYPGIVIAAVYSLSLCYLFALARLPNWNERSIALRNAFLVALASSLIVLPKYLPLVAYPGEFALIPPGDHTRLLPVHILLFFFGFESQNLPADVTMRSMFLPPLALTTLFFITPKVLRRNMDLIAAALFSLAIAISSPVSDALKGVLPGAPSSRFFLSDYRSFIHCALIVLSITSLQEVFDRKVSHLGVRIGLWAASASVLTGIAFYVLETRDVLSGVLGIVLAFIWGAVIAYGPRDRCQKPLVTLAVLAVFAGSSAFWQEHSRVWTHLKFDEYSRASWGFDFNHFYEQPRKLHSAYLIVPHSLAERPKRQGYPDYLSFGISGLYTGSYVDLAHDVGLRLNRILGLLEAKRQDANLDRFVMDSSAWFVVPPDRLEDPAEIDRCLRVDCESSAVDVEMKSFSGASATYSIIAEHAFALVENEVYFRGWQGWLVHPETPGSKPLRIEAREAAYGLRGWLLPPGVYELHTEFRLPFRRIAHAGSATGILVMLSFLLIPSPWKRRPESVPRAYPNQY